MDTFAWFVLWLILFVTFWGACRYHPRYSSYAMQYSPIVDFTGCLFTSALLVTIIYTAFAV